MLGVVGFTAAMGSGGGATTPQLLSWHGITCQSGPDTEENIITKCDFPADRQAAMQEKPCIISAVSFVDVFS